MLRDKLVFGVRDDRTKERMLRETDLKLSKDFDLCRAAESTKAQMREMSQTHDEETKVHELKGKKSRILWSHEEPRQTPLRR